MMNLLQRFRDRKTKTRSLEDLHIIGMALNSFTKEEGVDDKMCKQIYAIKEDVRSEIIRLRTTKFGRHKHGTEYQEV